ncbi:MAG: hypothetical protein JETT_1840 [Candidatus Jettenia ecosi]|uniref:Uncharacterized protein n=1 Tax=Candidatus Jettenia ecosi TaxID=2494326 RepID=A0A533QBV1_9BACT|nr:MAG: hypothetical protein JETT_1840 [Candidatus Jettenia ecosi]
MRFFAILLSEMTMIVILNEVKRLVDTYYKQNNGDLLVFQFHDIYSTSEESIKL